MKNIFQNHVTRIIGLSFLGFIIIAGYSMARASIDSLFLETYSNSALPKVWLLTSFVAAFVMAIYNQYSARKPLMRLMMVASILSAALLSLLLLGFQAGVPYILFFLYIWKDIYIVLLVEIFWSFSDVIFSIESARKGYGFLLALSTIGGIVGNLAVGPLAKKFGTVYALWIGVPLLLLIALVALAFAKLGGDHVPEKSKKKVPKLTDSIKVVKNSKYLVPLMCLVGLVQIVITLIDYQYNTALLQNYPDLDIRTDINGKVHAAIDTIAITLQILTGPILRVAGVAGTLVLIPTFIGAAILAFLNMPIFKLMMGVKITSKAFDYSIFRAAKEILYIPLSHEEKTQGKAVIDIFVYRTSKGLSSLILLGMIAIGLSGYTIHLTLLLEFAWVALTYIIVKRYRQVVPWKDELAMRNQVKK